MAWVMVVQERGLSGGERQSALRVNASRRRGWGKAGDDEAVGDRLREEPTS
jgi:hypothetical protein